VSKYAWLIVEADGRELREEHAFAHGVHAIAAARSRLPSGGRIAISERAEPEDWPVGAWVDQPTGAAWEPPA
jgi:hypothetical protein